MDNKVYTIITDRIIKLLESGTVPWHKPWAGDFAMPKNLVSGKEYRGVNTFLLGSLGFDSPYWVSFKQARDKGGTVKKGSKGFPCVFWKLFESTDKKTGKETTFPMLRYYTVFNTEQCDGVETPERPTIDNDFQPIAACQTIVEDMPKPPEITYQEGRAYYRSATDSVNMPKPESFDTPENYYSTLFHELAHATGHKSRLNRAASVGIAAFGSQSYSKEELLAEMGAAFLSGHARIEAAILDNSASYIASWLKRLRNDPKLVVQAAGQAQKATDFILDRHFD